MAYKIVGICESRSGDVEFLPEWAIGSPNDFAALVDAEQVRLAMQAFVDKQKAERAASAGASLAGPAIRYVVLPAIDPSLQRQLQPAPQPSAPEPSLNFGNGARSTA